MLKCAAIQLAALLRYPRSTQHTICLMPFVLLLDTFTNRDDTEESMPHAFHVVHDLLDMYNRSRTSHSRHRLGCYGTLAYEWVMALSFGHRTPAQERWCSTYAWYGIACGIMLLQGAGRKPFLHSENSAFGRDCLGNIFSFLNPPSTHLRIDLTGHNTPSTSTELAPNSKSLYIVNISHSIQISTSHFLEHLIPNISTLPTLCLTTHLTIRSILRTPGTVDGPPGARLRPDQVSVISSVHISWTISLFNHRR